MRDNRRRYCARRQALRPWYPGEPPGNQARHLHTLAAFISGMVGSKSSHLPSIATNMPDGAQPESGVKRLARWLQNDGMEEEVSFGPSADIFLSHLA